VKILFDHCLPRRLSRAFPNHAVRNTADRSWERLRNGRLLSAASNEFDVFLTIDKKLKHQQNLATLPVAVIVIMAPSNRLADLLPFVSAVEEELVRLRPRTLVEVFPPRIC
jgi:predicted nuclease of predicted toxin-antitoxin system